VRGCGFGTIHTAIYFAVAGKVVGFRRLLGRISRRIG
jgi:hypothetical protein